MEDSKLLTEMKMNYQEIEQDSKLLTEMKMNYQEIEQDSKLLTEMKMNYQEIEQDSKLLIQINRRDSNECKFQKVELKNNKIYKTSIIYEGYKSNFSLLPMNNSQITQTVRDNLYYYKKNENYISYDNWPSTNQLNDFLVETQREINKNNIFIFKLYKKDDDSYLYKNIVGNPLLSDVMAKFTSTIVNDETIISPTNNIIHKFPNKDEIIIFSNVYDFFFT